MPADGSDLLFANGVFQWVPDHQTVLRRLVETLPRNGVLAVQIPDITEIPALMLLRKLASWGPWADNPLMREAVRDELLSPESYYDLLKLLCARVDILHITYNHILIGPEAIVEWFMGSALQPFLSALKPKTTDDFLAAYAVQIDRHHTKRADGRVMLKLPRLFIVATR